MKATLQLMLEDVELFDTLEEDKAAEFAERTNGEVYSWKTIERSNWLEHGYGRVDTLALVVVPKGLPDRIDMADDVEEEGVVFP